MFVLVVPATWHTFVCARVYLMYMHTCFVSGADMNTDRCTAVTHYSAPANLSALGLDPKLCWSACMSMYIYSYASVHARVLERDVPIVTACACGCLYVYCSLVLVCETHMQTRV